MIVSGCGRIWSGKVGLGAVQQSPVQDDVDLLVVESDQPADGQQLPGGEVVGPGEIGVLRAAGADRPLRQAQGQGDGARAAAGASVRVS